MLDEYNVHAKSFKMAKERLKTKPIHDLKLVLISNRSKDGRIYNIPSILGVELCHHHNKDKIWGLWCVCVSVFFLDTTYKLGNVYIGLLDPQYQNILQWIKMILDIETQVKLITNIQYTIPSSMSSTKIVVELVNRSSSSESKLFLEIISALWKKNCV